jgi:TonB-linked SusC/RagA family outer membrane protein
MKKRLLMFLILVPVLISAQNKQINGVVIDKSGETIIGATIKEIGGNKTTITDNNGKFTITVNPKSTLLVSYIGCKSKDVVIGSSNTLVVTLEENSEALDEIVVVAYGSQKKIALTGSISSVSQRSLKQSSSPALSNALTGKVAGLITVQSTGLPGQDDAQIYIRGKSSFSTQDPLVLVDGVQQDMDMFRVIDPNEVESLSVLKDASATAIFGVRGANGVILVTTKRGSEGKPQIQISLNHSWTTFIKTPDRVGIADYMRLCNEAAENSGSTIPYTNDVQEKYLNPLSGLDSSDPNYAEQAAVRKYIYPNNNFYNIYFKKYAPQTRANMNLSGGSKSFKYFVNVAYLNQGSNIRTADPDVLGYDPSPRDERYNYRANLDYQISRNLKASLNLGSYIEKVSFFNTYGASGSTPAALRQSAIIRMIHYIYNTPPFTIGPSTIAYDGVPAGIAVVADAIDTYNTPYKYINAGKREDVISNFQNAFSLDWDLGWITPGLSIRGSASYDGNGQLTTTNFQDIRVVIATRVGDELVYDTQGKDLTPTYQGITQSAKNTFKINGQFQANYNRTFDKKHNFTAMLLGQRDYWETNSSEAPYNLIDFSGRVQYGYDSRYIVEFDFGYNGSETFAPSKRFGFFPSFSSTWIASNEAFLKDNNILTMLKFRGSYGTVGDDNGIARFLYNGADGNLYSSGTYTSGSWLTVTPASSELGDGQLIRYGTIGNSGVTWAVEKKLNVGVDLELIRELKVSIDAFSNKRTGILLSRGGVPAIQGYDLSLLPSANVGAINNEGYELEATYEKKINRDFSIMLSSTYSYNRNKVINKEEVPNSDYAYPYRTEGYSVDQQWGYEIDYSNGNGYFNTQEELDDCPYTYKIGTPRLGDFKYKDLNGDNCIDDEDMAPIGYSSGLPRVTYTGSLGVTYKDFDLNVMMQGVSKVTVNRDIADLIESTTGFGTQHLHAWTQERYENDPSSITYPALSSSGVSTSLQKNSFFLQDASYLRIRNLEVGYTVPKKVIQHAKLSQARIFINAQNLATWDAQTIKSIDPEQSSAQVYPLTKMYSIGLNVSF